MGLQTIKRFDTDSQTEQIAFAPVTRVDREKREVTVIATSEAVDSYGTRFNYEASKKAFETWQRNVREMHERKAVGRGVSIVFDDAARNIAVTTRVSKGAQDTWEKILDGTLTGASIGANRVIWERAADGVQTAKSYELAELSFVDVPSNPDARGFTFVRRDGVTDVVRADAVDEDPTEESRPAEDSKNAEEGGDQGAVADDEGDAKIMVKGKRGAAGAPGETVTTVVSADETRGFQSPGHYTQKDRDQISAESPEDFAGPNQSFPIKTQQDVHDAAGLVGHADDPAAVKANIKSIAKRKGFSLPDAWQKEDETPRFALPDFSLPEPDPNDVKLQLQLKNNPDGGIAQRWRREAEEGYVTVAGELVGRTVEQGEFEPYDQYIYRRRMEMGRAEVKALANIKAFYAERVTGSRNPQATETKAPSVVDTMNPSTAGHQDILQSGAGAGSGDVEVPSPARAMATAKQGALGTATGGKEGGEQDIQAKTLNGSYDNDGDDDNDDDGSGLGDTAKKDLPSQQAPGKATKLPAKVSLDSQEGDAPASARTVEADEERAPGRGRQGITKAAVHQLRDHHV